MRVLVTVIVILTVAFPASAQQAPWCGYVLLEGLSPVENQLAVVGLEVLTPVRDEAMSQPDELLQYRYSLDSTKVILEGCFRFYPDIDLLLSIMSYTFNKPVEEIGADLTYTIFGPDGNRDVGAIQVRDFIHQHSAEWEQ